MILTQNEEKLFHIQNFGAQGEGVALEAGMPVFIEGALPGEDVLARVTQCKARYAKAALCKVMSPSPRRVSPACPYANRCGGCSLLHMDAKTQAELKRDMVKNALWHVGRIAPDSYELLPVISGPAEQSRNKTVYQRFDIYTCLLHHHRIHTNRCKAG